MATINGKALVKDGKAVDKVFSNGRQVYGRNLLTGTSNGIKSATGGDWLIKTIGQFSYENSRQYTATVKIEKNDNPMSFEVWQGNTNGNRIVLIKNVIITGLGTVPITFKAPDENDGKTILLQLAWTNKGASGSYSWRQVKAEKGTISTPWTPAPEDYI